MRLWPVMGRDEKGGEMKRKRVRGRDKVKGGGLEEEKLTPGCGVLL